MTKTGHIFSLESRDALASLLFCKFAVKLNNILKWNISTTETALTAHVVVDDLSCWPQVSEHLKHELEEHGIAHATLEPETEDCHCHNREC